MVGFLIFVVIVISIVLGGNNLFIVNFNLFNVCEYFLKKILLLLILLVWINGIFLLKYFGLLWGLVENLFFLIWVIFFKIIFFYFWLNFLNFNFGIVIIYFF